MMWISSGFLHNFFRLHLFYCTSNRPKSQDSQVSIFSYIKGTSVVFDTSCVIR